VTGLAGPEIAEALADVVREDDTWTTMWDEHLSMMIAGQATGEGRATVKNVERIAMAMREVTDAALRESGRSARVAELSTQLARRTGMPRSERRAIGVAARLLDIGQLGVPRHITEKPAILSLEEMELMRHHPGLGAAD
jgi:response regulator RpfG family c-di-GMP phosphodiesterase